MMEYVLPILFLYACNLLTVACFRDGLIEFVKNKRWAYWAVIVTFLIPGAYLGIYALILFGLIAGGLLAGGIYMIIEPFILFQDLHSKISKENDN